MNSNPLRVSKTQKEVSLWVHPEGRVSGAIYLRGESAEYAKERASEAFNQTSPFIVLSCMGPDNTRFYSKRGIVRIEYEDADERPVTEGVAEFGCSLTMMDGSTITGTIIEVLKPESARLYDYLNITEHRFIKIHLQNNEICLINKAYIVRVTPVSV